MMNKSLLFTANRILLALFFALTSFLVNGQTYIVKTNVSSSQSRSTVYDYYFRSNSTNITPITSVTANYYYLIFNQKPTQFYYYEYNPENYGCSGPCGEEWTAGLNAIFSSNSCDPLIEGFYYGYDGPFNSEVPFVSLISNQVLVPPTATTDTFCDFVTLKAEGCTGTQRFFWHYSTNGSTYVNTNISTGFNEDFVFDKATYLPANYSGNIYFKVLIDSDSSITGDNIFSNIVSYNVRPCSPQIVGSPVLVQNVCSDSNHATATFTFDRPLNSGEYFSMTLLQETTPGNFSFFNSEPIYAADFTNQQYTAINLEPGVYLLRYQTLFTSNNLASSQPEDSDPFTITAPAPVTFSTTQVNVLCKNEPTGSITVTALGGSGSYLYSKDNGTTWQTTNLFSGLVAG
ncbi:SprB repeat-containing protein, partial [Flavobacterium sp.]|uniref:SprB repeat-containing protein n=1 Tax=Flavobacterium sp. TaxID=239 RepID=UPI0025B897B2